jgi:hypothetical protein
MAPAMLLLGSVCFILVWTLLALYLGRQCSWMAVLGAVDAALLLRLGGMPAGRRRVVLAMVATLAIILVFNWAMVATQIGMVMGLNPWDSALKLGMDHAQILAGLANNGIDVAWMVAALAVAWLLAR